MSIIFTRTFFTRTFFIDPFEKQQLDNFTKKAKSSRQKSVERDFGKQIENRGRTKESVQKSLEIILDKIVWKSQREWKKSRDILGKIKEHECNALLSFKDEKC